MIFRKCEKIKDIKEIYNLEKDETTLIYKEKFRNKWTDKVIWFNGKLKSKKFFDAVKKIMECENNEK